MDGCMDGRVDELSDGMSDRFPMDLFSVLSFDFKSNSSPWQRNSLMINTEELRDITQAVTAVSQELAVIIKDVRIFFYRF